GLRGRARPRRGGPGARARPGAGAGDGLPGARLDRPLPRHRQLRHHAHRRAAARGTDLVGLTLGEALPRLRSRVRILAIMRKGRLRAMAPDLRITDATVLVLAGTQEDLAAYDAQFQSHEVSEDPVVILGGGRVGRAASRALSEEGVPSTIVELEPGRVENSYSVLEGTASYAVVSGDAADQRILR